MPTHLQVSLLDSHSPDWARSVDNLRARLGAPHNPALFPPHFLKGAFPRIGGRIIEFARSSEFVGAGFLFPRPLDKMPAYTLRYHSVSEQPVEHEQELEITELAATLLGAPAVFYDPLLAQQYRRTDREMGNIRVGAPSESEADAIRELQRVLWGAAADNLYPADIHSIAFSLATSLVARVDGTMAGFCFGFYKLGGPSGAGSGRYSGDVRIESQLMAVSSDYRRHGIAAILKRAQAERARAQGIDVINWTVDPLQYANARLNYNELGAVAFDFFPNYLLDFRNDLNQTPASRFAITWVVSREGPCDLQGQAQVCDTAKLPHLSPMLGKDEPLAAGNSVVAIEIPADWNALQAQDVEEAGRWRAATDELFARYIGNAAGKYAVTGAFAEHERRYLVARRNA